MTGTSMWIGGIGNRLRTWTLVAALGGLLVAVGGLLGGTGGMTIALAAAVAINGFVYWKSDSIALRANGARELGPDEQPRLRDIVRSLAARAGLPEPRLYLVERPEPNAFATGRDPAHSAVAVTTGLLELVDERQLTGILAHELSHVANRDTLVGTIAATIAAAISWLAQMAQFQMLFGGGDEEGANPIGALAAAILAPIAALVIQLAVSRDREYLADSSGARLTGDPEGLAQALEKLGAASRDAGLLARIKAGRGRRGGRDDGRADAPAPALDPAFASLYIAGPLARADVSGIFSTHPPIPARAARLRAMRGTSAGAPAAAIR